jgi:DNA-binding response OmpR family regulator
MPANILVVEDDPLMVDSLSFILDQAGYAVSSAENGEVAVRQARGASPALVLLDVALPDLSGFEVCRQLRTLTNAPILFLTARHHEVDKVRGLDAGGDDYITKPVGSAELLARVRAHLRRAAAASGALPPAETYVAGDLVVDVGAHEVRVAGLPVELTPREFDILRVLALNAGRVVPRQSLFDNVWGPDFFGDVKALDVYIRSLRKKIEEDPESPRRLLTVRGVGYKLQSGGD